MLHASLLLLGAAAPRLPLQTLAPSTDTKVPSNNIALVQPEVTGEMDGKPERGEPGIKCWEGCDNKVGKCPDFCGRPGLWSGSCCVLQALGTQQPKECNNRGCIGYACCVQDWGETPPGMNED